MLGNANTNPLSRSDEKLADRVDGPPGPSTGANRPLATSFPVTISSSFSRSELSFAPLETEGPAPIATRKKTPRRSALPSVGVARATRDDRDPFTYIKTEKGTRRTDIGIGA